jgi:Zn-dependent protease with chaperone function
VISAAPTIVTLQTDSAWIVILAVSLVTFPVVVLLRRLIARPGGVMSGVLLALPLVLPLAAALIFQRAVFPEIAVLRPASTTLFGDSHVLFVRDMGSSLLIPYQLSGYSGFWLLVIAGGASALMLLRRLVCAVAAQRLMRRCTPAAASEHKAALEAIARFSTDLGLVPAPQLLLLPSDRPGVFCSGRHGGQIFVSQQLLDRLTPAETEAVLAHEIAHLRSLDTKVTFIAGLLRDMVVWNPVAHLTYRRLLADRELEADRTAASLTGKPLAVAAGLLKVCEAIRGNRAAPASTMAFLRPQGRLRRRVKALLALSDAGYVALPDSRMPYLLAGLMVAVMGLQVGAQIAQQEQPFFGIVLGAPSSDSVEVWPVESDGARLARQSGPDAMTWPKALKKAKARAKEARIAMIRDSHPNLVYGFREQDLGRWMRTMEIVAALRGTTASKVPQRAPQAWRADLLARPGFGPFTLVRIHEQNLARKEASAR